jgi:NADPH oxidase
MYRISNADPADLGEIFDDKFDSESDRNIWMLLFASVPGATGHAMLLILVVMYIFAKKQNRSKRFEAFWYTHHLFIAFYGLLLAHGTLQSTNMRCLLWNLLMMIVTAGTVALLQPPEFWMWFIFPGFVYAMERAIRMWRSKRKAKILEVPYLYKWDPLQVVTIIFLQVKHEPAKVLKLVWKCPKRFEYKPGQYVFLNCREISKVFPLLFSC